MATQDQYPGHNAHYIGGANSTAITLEGCNFFAFVVGVILSPTGQTLNAENIYLRDCQFQFHKVAVAICQGQSRNVVLENVASYGSQFFVSNRSYGIGGTTQPPFIHGANVGACKYLFNILTTGQSFVVVSLYCESTLSMGYVGTGASSALCAASFTGCTFNFWETLPAIDTHLWSFTPVHFTGCTLVTSGNLDNLKRQPISFFNKAPLSFSSCSFVDPDNNGALQYGFQDPLSVTFDEVVVSDATLTTGVSYLRSRYVVPVTNPPYDAINRWPLPPGAFIFFSGDANMFRATQSWLNEVSIGRVTVTRTAAGYATFTPADVRQLRVGDLIYDNTGWYGEEYPPAQNYLNTGVSGVVDSIGTSSVTIRFVPETLDALLQTGPQSHDLSVRWMPRYHRPTTGTMTEASADITNVSDTTAWRVGDRIKGLYIPTGAQITAIDATSSKLTINIPATATSGANEKLYDNWVARYISQVSPE